jgi:hypothetical protein
MAQQKSITFFFRKKREISEVDENDDVKEVTDTIRSIKRIPFIFKGCCYNSKTSKNSIKYTRSITFTNFSTKF